MNLSDQLVPQESPASDPLAGIVVRSYTTVGQVKALGKIDIDALELLFMDQRRSSHAVRLNIETHGDYPQTSVIAIDYSDIDSLTSAIDRLLSVSISTHKFAFAEVEYTIDGLTIVVFNDAKGKLRFIIKTQAASVHFPAMSFLADLKNYIIRAKQHLDEHKTDF